MDGLEVRPSRIHGKGLFAVRLLPARRKIGELGGELIGLVEARRRARGSRCVTIVCLQRSGAGQDARRPFSQPGRMMGSWISAGS